MLQPHMLACSWRSAGYLIVLSAAVAGCAQQAPTSGSAIDRANANFTQTVATGAVTGAAAGALAGGLLGGGRGAAIGAVAGGAIGTGAGYAVARNNQSQAQTEDTLNGQIDTAQQRATDAAAAATEAHEVAVQAQAQSRSLLTKYRAGQISAAEYQRQLSSSTEKARSIQKLLGNLDAEQNTLRQQIAAAGPNSALLRQASGQIQGSHDSIQKSFEEITAATRAVPQA